MFVDVHFNVFVSVGSRRTARLWGGGTLPSRKPRRAARMEPRPPVENLIFAARMEPRPPVETLIFAAQVEPLPPAETLIFAARMEPRPPVENLIFAARVEPRPPAANHSVVQQEF